MWISSGHHLIALLLICGAVVVPSDAKPCLSCIRGLRTRLRDILYGPVPGGLDHSVEFRFEARNRHQEKLMEDQGKEQLQQLQQKLLQQRRQQLREKVLQQLKQQKQQQLREKILQQQQQNQQFQVKLLQPHPLLAILQALGPHQRQEQQQQESKLLNQLKYLQQQQQSQRVQELQIVSLRKQQPSQPIAIPKLPEGPSEPSVKILFLPSSNPEAPAREAPTGKLLVVSPVATGYGVQALKETDSQQYLQKVLKRLQTQLAQHKDLLQKLQHQRGLANLQNPFQKPGQYDVLQEKLSIRQRDLENLIRLAALRKAERRLGQLRRLRELEFAKIKLKVTEALLRQEALKLEQELGLQYQNQKQSKNLMQGNLIQGQKLLPNLGQGKQIQAQPQGQTQSLIQGQVNTGVSFNNSGSVQRQSHGLGKVNIADKSQNQKLQSHGLGKVNIADKSQNQKLQPHGLGKVNIADKSQNQKLQQSQLGSGPRPVLKNTAPGETVKPNPKQK